MMFKIDATDFDGCVYETDDAGRIVAAARNLDDEGCEAPTIVVGRPSPAGPVAYFLADGVGDAGVIDGPFHSYKAADRTRFQWSIGGDCVVISPAGCDRARSEIADYLNRKVGR